MNDSEAAAAVHTRSLSNVELLEMIHAAGIRPSVQRIAILGHIANGRAHPSAEGIYSSLAPEFPSLSRTTLYNTLHTIAEAGLLRELEIESGTRRYDLKPQPPHSHFICRRCGRVFDMKLPEGLERSADDGFSIDSVDLYFKGICPGCKQNSINNNK